MNLCFWLLAHWSHWSHCNFIISYLKISHSLVSFKKNIFDSSIFVNKTSKESEIKLHNGRRHKNVENKLNFPKICKSRRLFILNPKSAHYCFCQLMKRNHKTMLVCSFKRIVGLIISFVRSFWIRIFRSNKPSFYRKLVLCKIDN